MKNKQQLKDYRGAIEAGQEKQRAYQRKKEAPKLKKPDNARFKLVVYFKDGNECTFYSIDKIYSHELKKLIVDEWAGLMKLQRLIHKYKDKFTSLCIYANVHPFALSNYQFYECPIYISKPPKFTYTNPTVKFLPNGRCNVELLKYSK